MNKEEYLIDLFGSQEARSKNLHDLIDQDRLAQHDFFYFKQGYCLRDAEIEELKQALCKVIELQLKDKESLQAKLKVAVGALYDCINNTDTTITTQVIIKRALKEVNKQKDEVKRDF